MTTSDEAFKQEVVAALSRDRFVDAAKITVEVDVGKVQLGGSASSHAGAGHRWNQQSIVDSRRDRRWQ